MREREREREQEVEAGAERRAESTKSPDRSHGSQLAPTDCPLHPHHHPYAFTSLLELHKP